MSRIDKKNHPFLFSVWNKKPFFPGVKDEAVSLFNKLVNHRGITTPVNYVCKTFLNDAYDNWEKLIDYVFLKKGEYFYVFSGGSICKIIVEREGKLDTAVYTMCLVNSNGISVFYTDSDTGQSAVSWYSLRDYDEFEVNVLRETFLSVHAFVDLAENEKRVLPAKKTTKLFHCVYNNKMPFDVNILDVNWYTESCQSHPFVVRGHWRMQAHGKGRKERKLKWIDPFVKNGYKKGAYKDA
jgi:hypothetical protein